MRIQKVLYFLCNIYTAFFSIRYTNFYHINGQKSLGCVLNFNAKHGLFFTGYEFADFFILF